MNVVPETVPVRAIAEFVPEQIVCNAGAAIATGNGFTVIRTGALTMLPHEDEPVVVATIWKYVEVVNEEGW